MGATFLDLFAAKVALELGVLPPDQGRAVLAEADQAGEGFLPRAERSGVAAEQLRLIDQGARRCLFLKGEDTYRRVLAQVAPGLSAEQVQGCARQAHQSQRRLGQALIEAGLLDEARDREIIARVQESMQREGQETVRGLRERGFEGIEAPSRMVATVAAQLARAAGPAARKTSRRQRKVSGRAPRHSETAASPRHSETASALDQARFGERGGAAVAEGTPQEPLPSPPPLPAFSALPPTPLPPLPTSGMETIGQAEVTAEMSAPSLPTELQGSGLEEKYQVARKLGEGGMGAVYLAYAKDDLSQHKPMALKVVRAGVSNERSKEAAARFKREILATSMCAHESIIEIYDANETRDGSYYMAMEYLEGEQLDEVLKREGKLPIPRLVELLEQVLLGMVAYHGANIVHRDIKPQNFRVWRDAAGRERLKIMDFGIARVLDAADSGMEEQFYKTISGKITGSPAYLSPESITDPDHVDQRADLYSLGITIYRLAANRLPFVAREASEFLPLHLYSKPPSLLEIAPDTPPALEAFYYKLLEKIPGQRYQTAEEALEVLRREVKPALGLGGALPPVTDPEVTEITTGQPAAAVEAPPGPAPAAADQDATIPPDFARKGPPADRAETTPPAPAQVQTARPVGTSGAPAASPRRGRGKVLLLVLLVLLLAGASGAYWAHSTGRLVIPGVPR